jgi:hypothetical protein
MSNSYDVVKQIPATNYNQGKYYNATNVAIGHGMGRRVITRNKQKTESITVFD